MISLTGIEKALENGTATGFFVSQLDGGKWLASITFDNREMMQSNGITPSYAADKLTLALMDDAAKESNV